MRRQIFLEFSKGSEGIQMFTVQKTALVLKNTARHKKMIEACDKSPEDKKKKIIMKKKTLKKPTTFLKSVEGSVWTARACALPGRVRSGRRNIRWKGWVGVRGNHVLLEERKKKNLKEHKRMVLDQRNQCISIALNLLLPRLCKAVVL